MTSRTAELFEKPRRPRRVLMRVYDAGVFECDDGPGMVGPVRMKCSRCGHLTEWIDLLMSVAKRGIPCPKCSGSAS